jgi:hypothetical protein
MADSEIYKGYEILINETGGQWGYDILGLPHTPEYRHPLTYDSREETLDEAKKAIDNLRGGKSHA